MRWSLLRLRTRTLLVLVACFAIGCWGWVNFLSPTHRWQRAIRSDNESGLRWEAASRAIQGKIPGIDRALVIATLSSAMSDPSPRVRETAARSLGMLRGPEAQPAAPLLAAALTDPSTTVRLMAGSALGAIAEHDPDSWPIAVPAFLGALGDRNPDVRINAGYWLTLMDRSEPAIPVLEAALRDGHDTHLKAAFALGLCGSSHPSAIEALEMTARRSSDPRMKQAAKQALDRLAAALKQPAP